MAVKAGGPDPEANRQLGELIRLAKANSVPLEVRFLFIIFFFDIVLDISHL